MLNSGKIYSLGFVVICVAACGSGDGRTDEFSFTPRSLTAPAKPQVYTSPDPQDDGEFGFATAFAGEFAVFGAPGEFGGTGAVYFFDSLSGELRRTVLPPDVNTSGRFGAALSANAVVMVVGSPGDSPDGLAVGRAFVFAPGETTPRLVFQSGNPERNGMFGFAVAAADINFVIGAPGESVVEPTAPIAVAGRAYYFDCATEDILQAFESPNAETGGRFGAAVATVNFDVFVGAPDENAGAGRVYHFDGLTGALLHTYTSPSPVEDGAFGGSIVVVGDALLIGAPGETIAQVGTVFEGRAHFVEIATGDVRFSLNSPFGESGGLFGARVASNGNQLVVAAPNELGAGIVHIFAADGIPVTSLMSAQGTFNGRFGLALAAAPEDLLVGAPGESGGFDGAAGAGYLNPPTFVEPQ